MFRFMNALPRVKIEYGEDVHPMESESSYSLGYLLL